MRLPFQSSLKLRVAPADLDRRRRNLIAVSSAMIVIALMGALTYYSVPLYRLFCQATGLGGTTQVARVAPGAVPGPPIDRSRRCPNNKSPTYGRAAAWAWRLRPSSTDIPGRCTCWNWPIPWIYPASSARKCRRAVRSHEGGGGSARREADCARSGLGQTVRRQNDHFGNATHAALRRTHLKYHLFAIEVLTPAQLQRYAELRGYKTGMQHPHGRHQ